MSENVGAIEYTCSIELDEFLRNKNRLQREIDDVEKRGDQMGAAMTTMAKAVAGAIAAIQLGKLITGLIDTQRQFDVMNASLKTLTGSQEAANAAFDRLKTFASTTPYDLQQVVAAFTKMKALGLDPTEKALTSFGNTAAAMGKDLNQMVEAVADAATGEFERLKEFGIKASKQGDDVTFTFQGVETTIKASADNITQYLTGIGEVNFAGAMSERMNTLDGQISNLQDSMQDLYRAINDSGFGEAVAKSVQIATEAIQEMTKSVKAGELTEYFDGVKKILPVVEVAAMSLAGAMASRLVAAFIATATQAAASAAAMGTATIAARGFAGAMALVGGPIGIAITALGLLALNWDKVSGAADNAANLVERSAGRIQAALKMTGEAQTNNLRGLKSELQQQLLKAEKDAGTTTSLYGGKRDQKFIDADLAKVNALKKAIADVDTAMASRENYGNEDRRTAGPATPPPPPKSGGSSGGSARTKSEPRDFLGQMEEGFAKRVSDYGERNQNAMDRDAEKTAQDKAREDERKAQEQARGQQFAKNILYEAADPVEKLRMENEAKQAILDQFRTTDLANQAIYDEAKVVQEQLTADRIKAIADDRAEYERQKQQMSLNSAAQGFGQLAEVIGQSAGKQSAAYKAMFAVSKAFSIASSIMNIGKGMSDVLADGTPWPMKVAGMAMVAASGASIVASIKGASFGGGRQYGGPVSAGTMYRVNETGRPEMFTASSGGAQYMIPTVNGNVTPANKVGVGGAGGGAQQAAPNVAISMALQGVAMPDGWFAIRPEQAAEAVKSAFRDGWMAGFRG